MLSVGEILALKDWPRAINPSVMMDKPNENIEIYKGRFHLKNATASLLCEGVLTFKWLPSSGPVLLGETIDNDKDNLRVLAESAPIQLVINGNDVGEVLITRRTNISMEDRRFEFYGVTKFHCILGEKSKNVTSVNFSIVNFNEYTGYPIEYSDSTPSNGRQTLDLDICKIILDPVVDHREKLRSLREEGGFLILYAGLIEAKEGTLELHQISDIMDCLNYFLSFINGTRVAALFAKGINSDKIIWEDFANRINDLHIEPRTWSENFALMEFGPLWTKFYKIWSNNDTKVHLTFAIDWFVESNVNPVFRDSKIILAQSGLELICNWLGLGKKVVKYSQAGGQGPAEQKLRLLLRLMQMDEQIPKELTELKKYPSFVDGPLSVVSVRNALVHQDDDKIAQYGQLPIEVYYDVWKLATLYLELAILYLLEYEGKFSNRTWVRLAHFKVPWAAPDIV